MIHINKAVVKYHAELLKKGRTEHIQKAHNTKMSKRIVEIINIRTSDKRILFTISIKKQGFRNVVNKDRIESKNNMQIFE